METWDVAPLAAAAARAARRGQPGPVTLTLGCLLLIGALALLYLGQVSAVASANGRWQALQAEQTRLLRADQEAQARLANAQSPAHIEQRARALGMVAAPPGAITIIVAPAPTASAAQGGPP